MAYSEKVMDHYNNPRNVGSSGTLVKRAMEQEWPSRRTRMLSGDVMKLQIQVNEESGVIENAVFKTLGCGSAIARSQLRH